MRRGSVEAAVVEVGVARLNGHFHGRSRGVDVVVVVLRGWMGGALEAVCFARRRVGVGIGKTSCSKRWDVFLFRYFFLFGYLIWKYDMMNQSLSFRRGKYCSDVTKHFYCGAGCQ